MTFAFRLLFRMATKPNAGGAKELQIAVPKVGNPIRITNESGGSLETAEWLIAVSKGYPTEGSARRSGELFRQALLLVGALKRLGVDCGFDKKTQSFSTEVLAAMAKGGGTPRVTFHGLDVFEDNNVFHIGFRGKGGALIDTNQLEKYIGEYADASALTERQKIAAALINDSFYLPDASVAFVVLMTSIEALCEQAGVSQVQAQLIDDLILHVDGMLATLEDKVVISKGLSNLKRQGVRSAYMSKIRSLLGKADANRFDELYGLRGKFVHDGKLRGELGEHKNEALDLALRIFSADIGVP